MHSTFVYLVIEQACIVTMPTCIHIAIPYFFQVWLIAFCSLGASTLLVCAYELVSTIIQKRSSKVLFSKTFTYIGSLMFETALLKGNVSQVSQGPENLKSILYFVKQAASPR